jgi:copper chaperone CopZ
MDMENAMRDMDGLLEVAVSYANGTIAITYDPDEVSEAEILATVIRFGIKARVVSG